MVSGLAYVTAWGVDALFNEVPQHPGPPTLSSLPEYLVELIFAVGLLATLIALAGLRSAQRGRYGWAINVSFSAAFFGHALMLYATVDKLVRGTTEPGSHLFLLDTSLFVALIGMALLGITTLLAGVLPRWCGLALIVGYPLPVFFGRLQRVCTVRMGGGGPLGVSGVRPLVEG